MKINSNKQKDKFFVRKNDQLRTSPKILLIRNGQKMGVYLTSEALKIAYAEGMDLVEVAPQAKPPVCSIMDYGKFKFEQKQKLKKKEKNTGPKEKEISFRYVIDDHDLTTKINHIKEYLEAGDRVKITVKFKGRENAHKDQGLVTINKCLEALTEVADVEKSPSFEGNQLIARVKKK